MLRSWTARMPGDVAGTSRSLRPILPLPYRDPFQAQLEHFQRLIRLGEPPVVSVSDGANTLAATLAVAQSSREGRRCTPRRFGSST